MIHQRDKTSATTRAELHLTTYESCWGFYFSADIAWDYRLTSVDNAQFENFIGFGTPFFIYGVPVSRNSIDGAITLSNHITERLQSYIEAEAEAWNNSASYSLQFGLEYTY